MLSLLKRAHLCWPILTQRCKTDTQVSWVFESIRYLLQTGEFGTGDFTTRQLGGKSAGTVGEIRLWLFKYDFTQWILTEWADQNAVVQDSKVLFALSLTTSLNISKVLQLTQKQARATN